MPTENPRTRLRNHPVAERLLYRTNIQGWDECWLWLGSKNEKGYGHIRADMNGPVMQVHRVAYETWVGEIPEGLEIDHLCGTRNCVNPSHLEVVDRRTNVNRGRRNQNHGKTRCLHGHPFDAKNTYIDGRGNRACRRCGVERMRRYRTRKVAA
jgi:hypothetical protein